MSKTKKSVKFKIAHDTFKEVVNKITSITGVSDLTFQIEGKNVWVGAKDEIVLSLNLTKWLSDLKVKGKFKFTCPSPLVDMIMKTRGDLVLYYDGVDINVVSGRNKLQLTPLPSEDIKVDKKDMEEGWELPKTFLKSISNHLQYVSIQDIYNGASLALNIKCSKGVATLLMIDYYHLAMAKAYPTEKDKWDIEINEKLYAQDFQVLESLSSLYEEHLPTSITSYGFLMARSNNIRYLKPLEDDFEEDSLGFDSLDNMLKHLKSEKKKGKIIKLPITVGEMKKIVDEGMLLYSLQDSAKLTLKKGDKKVKLEITNIKGRLNTHINIKKKPTKDLEIFLDLGLIEDTISRIPDDEAYIQYIKERSVLVEIIGKDKELYGMYLSNLN